MCSKGTDWKIDKAGGAFRFDGDGKLIIKPLPSKRGMVHKILRALYNRESQMDETHRHFKKVMRMRKADLVRDYILAENIIADRMAKKLGKYMAQQMGLNKRG